MDIFKTEIAARVGQALGLPAAEVGPMLEAPKDPKRGDVALPCFKLVKPLAREGKSAAVDIAREIVAKTEKGDLLAAIEATGPFVNFKLAPGALQASVLKAIARPGRYGGSDEGKGKKIVLDYSSPNIAKPFHLGHLRSTVIGHSIRRLYESLGYEVVGVNHLGDWGTQFGFMMAAWQRPEWRKEAEDRIAAGESETEVFVAMYVRINRLSKEDPKVREEAQSWFRRLEQGDPEARKLWQYFIERSKREFSRIYAMLSIQHESDAGESFYEDKMKPVVELLRAKGVLTPGKPGKTDDEDEDGDDQGGDGRPWVVDMRTPEERQAHDAAQAEAEALEAAGKPIPVDLRNRLRAPGLGIALIVKSNGSTTYVTRDLAAAFYRQGTYAPEKIVYVVGAPQALHFAQLKEILRRAGQTWQEKMVHVPFGHYLGMKTREGRAVFLDDVLARAKALALEAARDAKKKQDMTEQELLDNAPKVGTAAVKFFDLKTNRANDITLPTDGQGGINYDRVLATDGETGPYVQMSYARCASILRKYGRDPLADVGSVNFTLLDEPETREVVKALGEHPARVRQALADHEPSTIARHLLDVTHALGTFYNKHKVLDAPEDVRKARALLVACARKVIAQCLDLLGIEALEKM